MLSFDELFTKPRKYATSFAELLPWFGLIAPGMVLCKDGSVLAGFTFEGDDVEGREDVEIDHRIDMLQTSLRTLNDRCTLWTIQERRFTNRYVHNDFSNPIARVIDQQWEQACGRGRRNARLRQCMFLSYNFPNKSEAFFEALRAEMVENDGQVIKAFSGLVKRRLSEKGAIARVRGQLAEIAHEFEKVLIAFWGRRRAWDFASWSRTSGGAVRAGEPGFRQRVRSIRRWGSAI